MRINFSRLNFAALMVSILLILAACADTAHSRLKKQVEETAKECPIRCADGVTIDNVTYQDDVVTYYATVNTPLISIKTLSLMQDAIKPMLVMAIKGANDPKVSAELEMCRDAGAQIRFVLSDASDQISIDIDPEEI